ncbi:MAG: hypothetical protein ACXV8R_12875 [Acidimicrobiia bacterium]
MSAPAPPPPTPTWVNPPSPPSPLDSSIFAHPIGTSTKPWYQRRSGRLLMAIPVALLLLLVGYLRFRPHDRIDAQPAAPTPAGFQVVTAPEYHLAVPASWNTKVLDKQEVQNVAHQISSDTEAFQRSSDAIEGTQIAAVDPATMDTVNVIPFKALDGDPRDPKIESVIRDSFTAEKTGLPTLALTVDPADVHGFPAATVRATINYRGTLVYVVSTVIQTGDHVFEMTVTSSSSAQSNALNARILPTFDPR